MHTTFRSGKTTTYLLMRKKEKKINKKTETAVKTRFLTW